VTHICGIVVIRWYTTLEATCSLGRFFSEINFSDYYF